MAAAWDPPEVEGHRMPLAAIRESVAAAVKEGVDTFLAAVALGDLAVLPPCNGKQLMTFSASTREAKGYNIHPDAMAREGAEFAAGVALGNFAVFPPFNAKQLLTFDASTGAVTCHPVPEAIGSGRGKFAGAVALGDLAVFPPSDADHLMTFDTKTCEVKCYPVPAAIGAGSNKFLAAVALGDLAVFPPCDAEHLLTFSSKTCKLNCYPIPEAMGAGSKKFQAGVALGDLAVFAPFNAKQVMTFHATTCEVRGYRISEAIATQGGKFADAVALGDIAVFPPYDAHQIMTFDAGTLQVRGHAIPQDIATRGGKFAAAVALGGCGVFPPCNANQVMTFDTRTSVVKGYPMPEAIAMGSGKFQLAVGLGDLAVFPPWKANQLAVFNRVVAELKEQDPDFWTSFTAGGPQKDAGKVLEAINKDERYVQFADRELSALITEDPVYFKAFTADGLQKDPQEVMKAMSKNLLYFHFAANRDPKLLERVLWTLDGRTWAGIFRFCVEDLGQALCQLAYLCKRWGKLDWWSRIYTIFSVLLGLAISLGKPLYDAREIRRAYQVVEKLKESIPRTEDSWVVPLPSEEEPELTSLLPSGEARRPFCSYIKYGSVFSVYVRISTVLLWAAILLCPIAKRSEYHCDVSTPPMLSFQLFLLAFMVHFSAQVLALARDTDWLRKTSESAFLKEAFFMLLGIWDIFNDMMFAMTISACDPISWFSWHVEIFGVSILPRHIMHFPFGLTLQHVVVFIMVFGVGICQALLGIVLIFIQIDPFFSSLAMKINELGLLLAATVAG